MRNARCVIVVIAITASELLFADTYSELSDFRQVEPTGRFYLVVKKAAGGPEDPGRGTPITFQIVEHKPGSPPIADAWSRFDWDTGETHHPDLSIPEGDRIVGQGKLTRCPKHIVLSSTGLGFVGIDVRGYNYGSLRSGDAVVIVGSDGNVRHRKHLIDLFTEKEISDFGGTAGGVSWPGGGWIDENRHEVIVVSGNYGSRGKPIKRHFRLVDLRSGDVRVASDAVIIAALAEANRGALEFALELAVEMKLKAATPHLLKLFADEQFPLKPRLQIAVALGRFGDKRGAALMATTAMESNENQEYAVGHLPEVLGDNAAPILCDILKKHGDSIRSAVYEGMDLISSEVAVQELIKLLDGMSSETAKKFAITALGNRAPTAKAAVPSLIKVLEAKPLGDGTLTTHHYAARALGHIGPDAKEALPELTKLAVINAQIQMERDKTNPPTKGNSLFARRIRLDEDFVEAIQKIKGK